MTRCLIAIATYCALCGVLVLFAVMAGGGE